MPITEAVALTAHSDPAVARIAESYIAEGVRLRVALLAQTAETHTVPAPGGDAGVVRTLRPIAMEPCGERNNGGPRG